MARLLRMMRRVISCAVVLWMLAPMHVAAANDAGIAVALDRPFCLADEMLNESLRRDPALQQRMDDQETLIRNHSRGFPGMRIPRKAATSSNFIIPVVIYIVHSGVAVGVAENLSAAQINSQMLALNTAFINTGIEFCLATTQAGSPLPGSPTPGIIRIQSPLTDHQTSDEAQLKALSTLPADRYLRIWVVSNIDNGSGIAGYSSFPGILPSLDGIVMRSDVFGDDSACPGCYNLLLSNNLGRILAHEAGHYLNLYHPFHAGCTGVVAADCATKGDMVCDTPQIAIATTGCPGSVLSCDGTTPALIHNEMDYTTDACRNIPFSNDQATRMLATLATVRQKLVSPQNLVYTGVQCAGAVLNAVFSADNYNACTNQVVTFTALPVAGASYTWDFGDGSLPVSGAGNSTPHTYSSAGTFTVTLTITSGSVSTSSAQQIFVTACSPIVSSQGNWYFGQRAALKFATGTPVAALDNGIDGAEACVSQSDPITGNLLFYSNGIQIFDKTHKAMAPGTQLGGNDSASNGAISIPDPANPGQYYVVYTGLTGGLKYSKVDLTDPNFPDGKLTGLDSVIAVGGSIAEHVTAVPACGGANYWVIDHSLSAQTFNVYALTSAGIALSNSYSVPSLGNIGILKASPDGTMLAIATQAGAALFDFDRATGATTLRHTLSKGVAGVSFSPDSKLLYTAGDTSAPAGAQSIYQYDLSVPDPNSTVEVVTSDLYAGFGFVTLQLGPDHKIYASQWGNGTGVDFLPVINYPNQRISAATPNACGYNSSGVSLQGKKTYIGLPNMIDALPQSQIPNDFSYTITSCTTAKFTAPACAASYAWDFGDGGTSIAQNPTHNYAANGTYVVTLTLNGLTVVQHSVVIGLPQSVATIFGPAQVCQASGVPPYFNYSATSQPGLNYQWVIGNGTISGLNGNNNVDVAWGPPALPHSVQLTVTDPVSGCVATKTLDVIQNCSPNQCVIPPEGLVNWWPFYETNKGVARDIAGTVNNVGVYVNGPVATNGVVGPALALDGTQSLEVANGPEVNFGSCTGNTAEPMTIDLWLKTNIAPGTGPTSGLLTILDKRVNPGPTGYHMFLFNGRLGFQIDGVNYGAPTSGPNYVDLADNNWHFVAVSLPMCSGIEDGFLYADGKRLLNIPRGPGFQNSAKLYIGARDPVFGTNFFKGAFDELEMFKNALTEDQLRPIYEAGRFGKCRVGLPHIDVDGDHTYDALTDGLLIYRYLLGITGPGLTTRALGLGANLTDPAAMVGHLDGIRPLFDVDGDGNFDARTDGLLILRYLFGLRGDSLIEGAVAANATRKTAEDIETYIQSVMP